MVSLNELFNKSSTVNAVHERVKSLLRLDADHTISALMGNEDVQDGSAAGRMLTGAAAQAHLIQLQEKRKKEDQKHIQTIQQLREALKQLDARIAELDVEIKDLIIQQGKAQQRADDAFERMRSLDEMIKATGVDGMTDAELNAIKKALGPQAEDITDDATLLALANDQMEQEKRDGIKAQEEADNLRKAIEAKKLQMDELIQTRREIHDDPSLSLEEKASKAQDALDRSFETDLVYAEGAEARDHINHMVDTDRDGQRSALDEAESFTLTDKPTAPPPVFS